MTTDKFLSKYLRNQSEIISSLVPKLSNSPSEKYFHQLRIATRRMRAALWILKHGPKVIAIVHLNTRLKKMGKLLGRIRDVDVAIADAKKYHVKVAELSLSRARLIRNMMKVKNTRHIKALFLGLEQARALVKNLDPQFIFEARNELKCFMDEQLDKTFSGAKSLHRLRIDMKKARYVLEAMGEPIDPLKPLQDALGEAHDLQILRDLVGKNKKLRTKECLLDKEAIRLIKPALIYASAQLQAADSTKESATTNTPKAKGREKFYAKSN